MTTQKGYEPAELAVTPSKYVSPERPLSERNRPLMRTPRPGAFEYRDIPSLCANERVPFKSAITIVSEAGQE